MKRIFTLFFSVLFLTTVMAQVPSGIFKKATVAPEIDGVVDVVWAEANTYNIDKPFQTNVPTLGTAGETTWKALWNADGVYILLTVKDDTFFPAYAGAVPGNNWEYDKPEIYFDVNYVLKDGLGSSGNKGHYQVAPGFEAAKLDGTPTTETNGVVYSFMVSGQTYLAEYFVPFSLLIDQGGIEVDKTGTIGFDVTIIDRDVEATGRQRAVWANVGAINESYSNMDDAGLVTFDGAEANVYVDVITLSAGTITADNGTLQMTPVIAPTDATNQKLKWTLTNETGTATISSTGLITAITNGTVTVKAEAIDGGWAESNEVTVTISGQVIDKNDIWNSMNLIQNWNFNGGKTGDWPTNWGGWHDAGGMAQPTALPVIEEGIVVIKTGLATDGQPWHYQLNQSGFKAEPNVPYTLKFKSWGSAAAPCVVDFESTGGSDLYARYGSSTDANAVNGSSEWNYSVTTDPTWFTMNVVFDKMIESTGQKLQFMISLSNETIYIDSVLVIKETDRLLSAKQLANNNSLRVYPNPVGAGNELTVSMTATNARVAIYNAVGQKMMEKVSVGNIAKFNVSSLRKGMYFVRLEDGSTQKFIR